MVEDVRVSLQRDLDILDPRILGIREEILPFQIVKMLDLIRVSAEVCKPFRMASSQLVQESAKRGVTTLTSLVFLSDGDEAVSKLMTEYEWSIQLGSRDHPSSLIRPLPLKRFVIISCTYVNSPPRPPYRGSLPENPLYQLFSPPLKRGSESENPNQE